MNKGERKVMWNRIKARQVYRLRNQGHTAKDIEVSTGVKPHQQANMYSLGERLCSL